MGAAPPSIVLRFRHLLASGRAPVCYTCVACALLTMRRRRAPVTGNLGCVNPARRLVEQWGTRSRRVGTWALAGRAF